MARQGWFDLTYNKQGWFDATRADPRDGWFDYTAVGPSDGNQNVPPLGATPAAPSPPSPAWLRQEQWDKERDKDKEKEDEDLRTAAEIYELWHGPLPGGPGGKKSKKSEKDEEGWWTAPSKLTPENDNGEIRHPITGEVIFRNASEEERETDAVDLELHRRMWADPLSAEDMALVAGPTPFQQAARPLLWLAAGATLMWLFMKHIEKPKAGVVAESTAIESTVLAASTNAQTKKVRSKKGRSKAGKR